eukprot:316410-Chlamydomonas_euryale.AAC.2
MSRWTDAVSSSLLIMTTRPSKWTAPVLQWILDDHTGHLYWIVTLRAAPPHTHSPPHTHTPAASA